MKNQNVILFQLGKDRFRALFTETDSDQGDTLCVCIRDWDEKLILCAFFDVIDEFFEVLRLKLHRTNVIVLS